MRSEIASSVRHLIAATSIAAVTVSPMRSAPPPFAYDREATFSIVENSREIRGNAAVRDITFFSVPGAKFGQTAAYVVEPRNQPVRAAVLWVHWLGDPPTTNRTEFLDEAIALAPRGVKSLLVDAMWAKPGWYRARVLDRDYEDGVAQVNALRRAADLLQRQPGAASVPFAIVAHDYGAMYSIIAAAQDRRAKACVFIACTASLADWAFFHEKPKLPDMYRRQNAPLELKPYLAQLEGTPLLFQFAEHDEYIPIAKAEEVFAAAKTPKQMVVYGGAGHDMSKPATIRLDRDTWLARALGL